MLVTSILLPIAAVLASIGAVQAVPAAGNRTAELVILETQPAPGGGTLNFWGLPVGAVPRAEIQELSAPESGLAKRCGGTNVECDFSNNRADASVCNQLINAIDGNTSPIGSNQRSVCLNLDNGGQCCISWNPGSNFPLGALRDPARKTWNNCRSSGLVSGRTVDTTIGTACGIQCLSNRSTGC